MADASSSQVGDSVVTAVEQAKDKPAVLQAISTIFQQADSRLWPIRRSGFEGVLHCIGESNLTYNPQSRRFAAPIAQSDFAQIPSINLIERASMVVYAQFMRADPQGIVVPNTADEEDRQGARAADSIRRFINWEDRMDRKIRRARMMSIVAGDAFLFSYIKADVTKPIPVPKMQNQTIMRTENGEAIPMEMLLQQEPGSIALARNPDGTPVMEQQPVQAIDPMTGEPLMDYIPSTDVSTDVWSAFETVLDFDADNLEDCRWAGSKRIKSIDWIGETFGSKGADAVQKEGKNMASFNWKISELMMRGVAGGGGLGVGGPSSGSVYALDNAVALMTFIRKPSLKHPRGQLILATEHTILHQSDNPWWDSSDPQKLGLVQFGYSPILGTPWHFGLPKNIIDVNRRIRSIHAFMIHNRRTQGFPVWLMPKGSTVMTESMSGKPGLILTYNPKFTGQFKPERIQPADPSQVVILELEKCESLLERIAGSEDVLAGEQPFAGMPAISLNMLAERAGARFTWHRQEFEEALGRCDNQRLQLLKKTRRWQREQVVKVMGRVGEIEADSFAAVDMADNVDVRYEIGSKRAASQVAHQANLFALIDRTLIDITNPTNRILLREEFGVGDFNDKESADYRRARWENAQMEKGRPPVIQPFENSEIHLAVHEEWMKAPEWDYLPDQIKSLALQHHMETVMKIDEEEKQAAATGFVEEGAAPNGQAGEIGATPENGNGAPPPPKDGAQQAAQGSSGSFDGGSGVPTGPGA